LTGAEYTEVVLHAVLQRLAQRSHILTLGAGIQAGQTGEGSLDVGFGSATVLDAFLQRAFKMQTGRTTEHYQVEQRVAAQTVGTVYGYAGHFTNCEQAFDEIGRASCRERAEISGGAGQGHM